MRTYRWLWSVPVTMLTAAAVATMVHRSEVSQVLALAVALGSLGAVLGLAWGSELSAPRHPVLVGGVVASVASLALPGLVGLVGWWAGPVCLLLAVTAPPVVGSARLRRVWGIVEPGSAVDQAGLRLRADWEATSKAVAASRCSDDLLVLAELRDRLLTEIEEHHGGTLPAYVWEPPVPRGAAPGGHERSGPGPRDLGP